MTHLWFLMSFAGGLHATSHYQLLRSLSQVITVSILVRVSLCVCVCVWPVLTAGEPLANYVTAFSMSYKIDPLCIAFGLTHGD